MNLLGYRAFSTELLKIATEVRDPDIRAMIAEAHGKEYLNGGALRTNSEVETNFKPKIATAFVVEGKGPVGMNTPYERLSNYAGAGLKGAMTGAGAGALLHTLRHGNSMELAPFHLGGWAGVGAGIGLADHALRHHFKIRRLHQMESGNSKVAMLGSQTFTPARALQTSQQQGHFENKLHRGTVTPTPGALGRGPGLPQGV